MDQNRTYTRLLLCMIAVTIVMSACKKTPIDSYNIPSTYNFDNVSYSGQTQRLDMLEEMTTYMKTGNTMGTQLDAQVLRDMYENNNDPFSFSSTKQLKNKCFLADQDLFVSYFDSIAAASASTVAGSNGVAGVVESNDASKKYLCSANGVEYTQLIEKGLMGAVFYYQATAVYLSTSKIGDDVDNTTIEPGEGTDMEHHWDEAFGYLGVPVDFPTNTDGIRFHGKYCNSRNDLLGTSSKLMNAFLVGRAAISNDDMATKWNIVPVVQAQWERVIAGTAIHYLNGAKADFGDDALRNHQLSEAYAFTMALKYNPAKVITDTQVQDALNAIGTNFYEVTVASLDQARDILSSAYGMDSVKDQL